MTLVLNSRFLRRLLVLAAIMVIGIVAAVFWFSRNVTAVVEQTLRRAYGPEISLERVESGWNRVVLRNVRLASPGGGPFRDRISIGEVVMILRFKALLTRRIEIDLLHVKNPRLWIEIAPDGTVISPLTPRHTPATSSGPKFPTLSLAIGRLKIDQGEVVFLDRSTERLRMSGVSNRSEGYHLLRLTDLRFITGPLVFPLKAEPLPVTLSLVVPGPGSLNVTGTFDPVTLDALLKITLRHWDLTRFRPSYLKPDDLDVTSGFLDGDSAVTITARKLHAPGEIRIRELEVDRSGRQGVFLGLPARAFLAVMKDTRGEIGTTFLVAGDLASPRFKVRQSLVEQIGSGLERKLGVPVISDVGSGIISLGKKGVSGIRSLFGRGE